jgi:hypothetical protein
MCAYAHLICLPPFLPEDFKDQAGRNQGLTIMCTPHLLLANFWPMIISVLMVCCLLCSLVARTIYCKSICGR